MHIVLPFLFLLSNSFVTAIGCCSLLLFVSQVVVLYQFIIIWWLLTYFRNSHHGYFIKKAILQNFAIFTGKHLYWSLRSMRTATLLKRDSNTGIFLWILRNFLKHLFWRTSANYCFEVVFIRMISCGISKSLNIRSWFIQSW